MNSAPHWLRVIVADDSAPVRDRMVSMLREIPNVKLAAETSDVPETISLLRNLNPDVLILDIGMPGGCGLDVLDAIRAEHIQTKTLVVTNYADTEYETKALQAGALAFLNKSRDFLKAIDLVRDLAAQNQPISSDTSNSDLLSPKSQETDSPTDFLSNENPQACGSPPPQPGD
jgi:DNA-binding NarL/FixJ family response regulator